MKKSLEDYKEMVVKPQFDWIKIPLERMDVDYDNFGMYTIYRILRQ